MSILRAAGLAISIGAFTAGTVRLAAEPKFLPNPGNPTGSRCADTTSLIGHAIGKKTRECVDISTTANTTLTKEVRTVGTHTWCPADSVVGVLSGKTGDAALAAAGLMGIVLAATSGRRKYVD